MCSWYWLCVPYCEHQHVAVAEDTDIASWKIFHLEGFSWGSEEAEEDTEEQLSEFFRLSIVKQIMPQNIYTSHI